MRTISRRLSGKDRHWPESTRRISQLRLTAEYEPRGFIARNFGSGKLHIDIVDYPGEWLLDLPLMQQSYAEWSAATVAASRVPPRAALRRRLARACWRASIRWRPPMNSTRSSAAEVFTAYLARCRKDDVSLSTLPPGRFLMPGDFAGSPLLAFAPLDIAPSTELPKGSLGALMAAALRLLCGEDRQAVLLRPLRQARPADRAGRHADRAQCRRQRGEGSAAGADRRSSPVSARARTRWSRRCSAAASTASCSPPPRPTCCTTPATTGWRPSSSSSSRRPWRAPNIPAPRLDVAALAAIRATREASVKQKGETLECIAGIAAGGRGHRQDAFRRRNRSRDLPRRPAGRTREPRLTARSKAVCKFVRFRPPLLKDGGYPHIRLDRAMEFLLGDRFA